MSEPADTATSDNNNYNDASGGAGSARRDSIAIGKTFKLVNSKTQVYTTRGPPGPLTAAGDDDTATADNNTDNTNVLVILLTNSLGLASENNLKLADRYARALNATVVVPDLFDGDPVANILEQSDLTPAQQQANNSPISLIGKVKLMVASTVKGFFNDMWAAKHAFEITNRRLAQTLQELVIETYKPTKVVLVGYSFGAKYVLHYLQTAATITSSSNNSSSESILAERIVCGACVHPSLLEPLDFAAIEKPLYFIYGRDDELLPEAIVRKCLEVHEDKHGAGVKIETAIYDNVAEQSAVATDSNKKDEASGLLPLPHGFAVPGDYPKSMVGERPDQVFRVLVSWIREHL
jgi:dienelactone hydrolase